MRYSRVKRVGLWWRRLRVLTAKELLQLSRDLALVFVIIYAFTVDIYIAGSGVSFQLNHAAVVVMDSDHSKASRELIYRFRPPYFRLDGEVPDASEGIRLLDQGKAMAMLDIPPDFQRLIQEGRSVGVQMQIDTSNAVLGTLAASYSSQIVGKFSLEAALARAGLTEESLDMLPRIEDRHRVWYNPNQNDAWFIAIAELMTVITVLSIVLPAAATVREKERGTIEQLIVSPLTPMQILLPKVLSMMLVILIGTAVSVFLILDLVFDIPFKGSLPLFFAVTMMYVFSTAGIGIVAATLTRNLAQVGMLTILILAPIILLSGAWTPPEAMPDGLRQAMFLSPLYYYIEMGYAILLKGAGLDILWDSLLGLALLGILIFTFGVWRFKRQFS
ncbi:MAG: ABC transporter permease [Proteobacteria bacterium]|nr:ABC transporter permease [Pseudomonadota bacterium]